MVFGPHREKKIPLFCKILGFISFDLGAGGSLKFGLMNKKTDKTCLTFAQQ